LKLNPRIEYSGGQRGWIGDNPFIFLDCTRIRSLGWKPRLTIRDAISRTLDYLNNTEPTSGSPPVHSVEPAEVLT
jgi:UDP-glucose 4-epimerase